MITITDIKDIVAFNEGNHQISHWCLDDFTVRDVQREDNIVFEEAKQLNYHNLEIREYVNIDMLFEASDDTS